MSSERIMISLEDTYAYIGRASDEENVEIFKTKVAEYINTLKEVIESDFDKLTDKELYELLSKVYSITLDEKDYLRMLSIYNNKQYKFIYRMPTTMTFTSRATEGYGRNLDWWNQLYQVYFLTAISDTFQFDYNKTYSKDEIKKLLSDKSIVILKQEEEAVDGSQDFVQEIFEPLPTLDIDLGDYGDNISRFVLNNYSLFGELLRKKFTKKTVLKDIRMSVNELNEEMQEIFSDAQTNDPLYSGFAALCKEWFESSDEKKEIQYIQKKLKPINKNAT